MGEYDANQSGGMQLLAEQCLGYLIAMGLLPAGTRPDPADPQFAYLLRVLSAVDSPTDHPARVAENISYFFTDSPGYERAALVVPGLDGTRTRRALQAVLAAIAELPEGDFTAGRLRGSVVAIASQQHIGRETLEQPLRVALTGSSGSIKLYKAIAAMGKERVTSRINRAIQELTVVA